MESAIKTTPPLVSVIVPSFNKRAFIDQTVASVQAQTSADWELLVIDDASSDGSPELIAKAAALDPRIRFIGFSENRGANECRNRGIAEARGRYVVFLDADDLLAPGCIKQRLATMLESNLHFAVFPMQVFHERVGDDLQRWTPTSRRPLEDFLRHELPWQTMQPIWDHQFLVRIGGFDPSFPRHQDVELHTRALLQPGVRYRLLPGEPDCFYRIGEDRKVFDPTRLLENFSLAAVMYRDKFADAAERLGRKNLALGIIQRTYLQILQHAKDQRIDPATLDRLEKVLFDADSGWRLSPLKQWLFGITRQYNLGPLRVPGVNRLLFELITW